MPLNLQQIKSLLYEQGHDSRFTQDSPVLPDVWAVYAEHPTERFDLLLTPYQAPGVTTLTPARLAATLQERLESGKANSKSYRVARNQPKHEVAVNQTTVAVKLSFDELVRVALPLSGWWQSQLSHVKDANAPRSSSMFVFGEMQTAAGRRRLANIFARPEAEQDRKVDSGLRWLLLVVGVISLENASAKRTKKKTQVPAWPIPTKESDRRKYFGAMLDAIAGLFAGADLEGPDVPLIYVICRNRPATTCLYRSVPAVKADAAVMLFNIDCSEITWAIVDSGVDAQHPAFRRRDGEGRLRSLDPEADWHNASRITSTYDFTLVRQLLSVEDADIAALPPRLKRVVKRDPSIRKQIRERLLTGREIDWPLLLPYLEVPHNESYVVPSHDHGTHVAGIVAANWLPGEDDEGRLDFALVGMCPTINIVDVRILNNEGQGDEFSVMAALQFLRYLNSHKDLMVVHGANLSLSILHDVANYACGRTPVCEECERLVSSGVVVVAAAGNDGFERDIGNSRSGDYRSISITDPGNAVGVITVGSTHRDMPHTYGVSYFSSRGPTGDGRLKPDVVAPGEKIDSTGPDSGLLRKDGTSMAAPHVSGAAALLIARHREFLGQPNRVKAVLCNSATDLGRERYFQGAGMLDVLRALQDV